MSMQKKTLIIGAHTLFFNGYFISDEAPRILASLIDDGFKIELLKIAPEEDEIIKNVEMPFWLREQLFVLDELPNDEKYHKDSFVIVGNIDDVKNLKIKLPIHTNYFNKTNAMNFDIADLIICFGFNDKYFKQFCKTNNLLCVAKGVFSFKNGKKYNAVAVSVEGDNNDETKDYAVRKFNIAVKDNMYKIQHDETIVGVSYKGRDLKTKVGSVPILFI